MSAKPIIIAQRGESARRQIELIEARVRPTIGRTYSSDRPGNAPRIEGRISEDDLNVLLALAMIGAEGQ